MEENAPWKAVFIGVFFSLLILGLAYFFISPQDSEFFSAEKTEKVTEFTKTRVGSHKEGKMSWEFYAEQGWTNKNQETTFLCDIKKGKTYNDGKPVIINLVAPYAKAERRSEIVEAFGFRENERQTHSKLHGSINLGRIKNANDKGEWSRLAADYLKYIPNEKKTELKGSVKLFKPDSSIFSEYMLIEHDPKKVTIDGDIILSRKDGRVYADKMIYMSESENLEANDNITLILKQGKIKTSIKCDQAVFNSDMNKDMVLKGHIKATQGKKIAIGDEGVYSSKNNSLFLKGKVKAVFEKAAAVLKESTLEKLDNPDTKKILKEKTVLTCSELVFSTKTGDATAAGHVFVYQKGKESKADKAIYDDKTETITLSGNVFMKDKEEEEWVSAQKVIISVKNETFDAVGSVEAQLVL